MLYLAVSWVLSSASLLGVAYLAPGFRIGGLEAAMIAAGAVALVAAVLGTLFHEITGPVGMIVSGLILFLTISVVFRLSALLVPGFAMQGFAPAFAGAGVVFLVQALLRSLSERLHSEEFWMRS
jgi:putative membrane protein